MNIVNIPLYEGVGLLTNLIFSDFQNGGKKFFLKEWNLFIYQLLITRGEGGRRVKEKKK